MLFIVATVFVLSSMLAITSNPDIFSPGKLFLFFFLSFYVGALFTETTTLTGLLILLVLAVGTWVVVLEAGRNREYPNLLLKAPPEASGSTSEKDHTAFLWLISIPTILVQLYMIQHFGGMEGYMRSLGLRVIEWAGFGWARMLIALMAPVNLVYFALGLRQRRNKAWWSLYAVHFLILLAMGALSGSRSGLLNVFLMQFVIYHYLRSTVRPRHAALLAVGLMTSAMFLGVLRNSIQYQTGTGFTTGTTSGETFSFASFTYGVEPLEVIARTEHMALAHGSTFLSLITNAIPRAIWAEKPSSGGIFFTQNYLGDAWEGYSNLTPTFLGEWIINFGWLPGIIGFSLSYSLIFFFLWRKYMSLLVRLRQRVTAKAAIDVVIYVHVVLAAIGLMVGEVTNVFITLVVSQLLPLWCIRYYIQRAAR